MWVDEQKVSSLFRPSITFFFLPAISSLLGVFQCQSNPACLLVILQVSLVIGQGGVGWILLAQDRDQWRALGNTVINLQVP
jgi:hypothetical protein